jgi:hypothetical protein
LAIGAAGVAAGNEISVSTENFIRYNSLEPTSAPAQMQTTLD